MGAGMRRLSTTNGWILDSVRAEIKLGMKKRLTAVCVVLQTVAQPFLELKFVLLISEICFVC